MRGQRTSEALAAVLTVAVVVIAPRPASANGFPRAPRGLPWPVIVPARNRRFAVLPDGHVIRAAALRPHAIGRVPKGSYFVERARETWVRVRGGHVIVVRGRRRIWRSSKRYGFKSAQGGLSTVVVSPVGIAYQVRRSGALWVASGRGSEGRVSAHGWPEMWTTHHRLISVEGTRKHGFTFRLRTANGRLDSTLAAHITTYLLDQSAELSAARSFLFWNADGELVRADGSGSRVLASARDLGFRTPPAIYPLDGGLIELLSRTWHEVVLRSNGSVFARASAPTDQSICCFGEQTAAADGSAVAYALTDESTGATSVYVLRAGDEGGTRIYHVAKGKGFPPSWHGRWVLFTDESDKTVALDTCCGHPSIDLTHVVARVRSENGGAAPRPVHWAFAPSRGLRARRSAHSS
jgi:hypothetical protein